MSHTNEQIMQMSSDKRYQYLLETIKKQKEIWILTDDDGCVMLNSDDEDCVPIWPSQSLAEYWATNDWSHCKATSVSVDHWQKKWTDGLIDDEINIAIFPNPNEMGLVLYPSEFAEDLV
jgi:hypothetical protein